MMSRTGWISFILPRGKVQGGEVGEATREFTSETNRTGFTQASTTCLLAPSPSWILLCIRHSPTLGLFVIASRFSGLMGELRHKWLTFIHIFLRLSPITSYFLPFSGPAFCCVIHNMKYDMASLHTGAPY